jgi:cytochrome c-type biogenesis protein CcmF
MAALITGHLDDSWLRAVRRWTMFSWLFLTLGLTLGMIWAYEELGWGGFWEWDPVENAALLPWFTATAFLHSVMVQERRSMLRIWNVTLVITTFFLTIFGTFMTRSGVVQSVHAFGQDTTLAWLFTGFMVAILVVSFGFVIYRLPLLQSRNTLDSWVSREAAFLLNNWILLFSAFFILFATMFPTLSEAIKGERLTVAAPFYNKWMAPVGLVLLLLTGIGPLLGWRKSTLSNLRNQFIWPIATMLVVGGGVLALGVRVWTAGICFALCGFVAGTVGQEFWHGVNVRRRATGTDVFTALVGLVGRNKRRYGGYIIHIGVVLMFLGFAGQTFKQDKQVALNPGQQASIGRYTVRYDSLHVEDDGQKQMITAYVTAFAGGKEIARLYPAKWAFRRHEQEPTTEVAMRRSFGEDLYVVLGGYDVGTQTVSLQLVINPLVDWIWLGFGVIAMGTGIVLLPERTYSFAMESLPTETAVGTVVALLLAVVLGSANVSAQMVGSTSTQTSFFDRTPFEKQMQHEIVCTCGCGHTNIAECRKDPCSTSHQMRGELAALIDQGKSHDEILQAFITKYGSEEMLGAPLDTGFNRLAWIVPYGVAGSSALLVGFVAMRLSRRRNEGGAEAGASTVDPNLEERLDDELRNLD